MEELDVVVVGAGIGGLTAAIALRRHGHRVRVIDQVRTVRPVGAGISLWSNGVKVLNALGLGPQIAAIGGHMRQLRYLDADGTPLCDIDLDPLVERVGQAPYPVRRADLQQMLLDEAGPDIQFATRCVGVTETPESVTAITEAGDHLTADLVVAADGTHSVLRTHVIGHETDRIYVGYHNWNSIVPTSLGDDPTTWTVAVGEGKRVSTMPVRDGQYCFFDVPLTDPTIHPDPTLDTLHREFGHWGPPVRRLLSELEPTAVAHVAIHSHRPLERFARGRVALLGDSAHTTAPDLGQGGCMAMEDALVLAHYVTTTNLGVVDALQRYSDERVPRAAEIITRAANRAALSHNDDPVRTQAWYDELATTDGADVIDGISRTILDGPCR